MSDNIRITNKDIPRDPTDIKLEEMTTNHCCTDEDHDGKCDNYLDHERVQGELFRDRVKWYTRRQFAKVAFIINAFITIFYLVIPLFVTCDQSKNLQDFSSIIITLIGFNSTIILAYIGAQSWVQNKENKMFFNK